MVFINIAIGLTIYLTELRVLNQHCCYISTNINKTITTTLTVQITMT